MSPRFTSMEEAAVYIRNKSIEDQEFRAELLSNPRAVLAKELDVTIPDAFEVQVHEETGMRAHFVIPPSSAIADAEMSAIAAGCNMATWC